MRTAFIESLCQLAAANPNIWLVNGDLGYSVVERFAERFPERYLNAGVAEQNMTGMAAGLAMSGKMVFTYSIANFPTLRCLEQVRNDVCYHNLNVKIVAVGGGLTYGAQGYSHHGVEDLAILSSLPNMTVVAPGDPVETRLAMQALTALPGPAYLRLGKAGEPVVHTTAPPFELGRAIEVRPGADAMIISTGGMLQTAVTAADLLAQKGVAAGVLSMPTLRPLDEAAIITAARRTGRIVTVEEHGPGGLGTLTAEVLALAGLAVRLVPVRLERRPASMAGSAAQLRSAFGLTPQRICDEVLKLLN